METMEKPKATRPRRRSMRGAWTVLAMFVLGGLVLAGLFLAPKAASPHVPAGIPWEAPAEPLRVVVYDAGPAGPGSGAEAMAADLLERTPSPDLVMVMGISADDAPALAAALKMQGAYDPRLFRQIPATRDGPTVGVCILSRYPLYDAAGINAGKTPIGVSAVCVAGGRKFWVACAVCLDGDGARGAEVIGAWQSAGFPPAILGGAFNAAGLATADTHVGEAFSGISLPLTGPLRRLCASPHWSALETTAWNATPRGARGTSAKLVKGR